MIDKEVLITLSTKQSDGADSEETEIITGGRYKSTADGYEISYDESEATGFVGSKTTLTTIGSRKVVMERTGSARSSLIIETDKKHHCHYGTPYGTFMLGVTANEIKSALNDNGGNLMFKYVIDINSSYMSDFEINISVK